MEGEKGGLGQINLYLSHFPQYTLLHKKLIFLFYILTFYVYICVLKEAMIFLLLCFDYLNTKIYLGGLVF